MNENTLIPDVNVGGITVRPWSLGQLVAASSHLADVLQTAEEIGFDVDKAFSGKFSQVKLAQLILKRIDVFAHILTISLEKPHDEILALGLGPVIGLVKVVIQVNRDHIKNWLAPLVANAKPEAGGKKAG